MVAKPRQILVAISGSGNFALYSSVKLIELSISFQNPVNLYIFSVIFPKKKLLFIPISIEMYFFLP